MNRGAERGPYRRHDGLVKFRDIALALGCPERTATSLYTRGMNKLRRDPLLIELFVLESLRAQSAECRVNLPLRGMSTDDEPEGEVAA